MAQAEWSEARVPRHAAVDGSQLVIAATSVLTLSVVLSGRVVVAGSGAATTSGTGATTLMKRNDHATV